MGYDGYYLGGPDSNGGAGPTITVVSPTPGVAPGLPGGFPKSFAQAKDTEIVLQVTDPAGLADVVVLATFLNYPTPGNQIVEAVFRRGAFLGNYLTLSYQVAIVDGVELHCRRVDGWPVGTGTLGDVKFSVDAIDDAGAIT